MGEDYQLELFYNDLDDMPVSPHIDICMEDTQQEKPTFLDLFMDAYDQSNKFQNQRL